MKVVLKNDEYTIYQRRDGRYAVEGADKKAINGDEKVAILVANDLIKAAVPAAPEPVEEAAEAAAEEAAEEAVAEAEDAAADETEAPAEDAAEEAGDTED
jgi:antitoxin component of MazEF toxin-antitoxin module